MKKLFLAACLAISFSNPAFANTTADTTLASEQSIQQLLKVTQVDQVIESAVSGARQMIEASISDKIKQHPNYAYTTPQQQAQIQQEIQAISEIYNKNLTIKLNELNLLDFIVQVYKKHYTQAEVNALLQFYETPAGQSLIAKQPMTTAETMALVRNKSETILQKVDDTMTSELEQKMANIFKILKQTKPPKK